MTIREVSAVLRIGRVTALRLVQSGQLRAFRAGRSWRIKREDLEGFMRPHVALKVQTI
jgi:excisionase family DNA binding protein